MTLQRFEPMNPKAPVPNTADLRHLDLQGLQTRARSLSIADWEDLGRDELIDAITSTVQTTGRQFSFDDSFIGVTGRDKRR